MPNYRSARLPSGLVAAAVLVVASAGCGGSRPASTAQRHPVAATSAAPAVTESAAPVVSASAAPSPTAAGVTIAFQVKAGKRVAGPDRCAVKLGEQVTIQVVADRRDELHVHGYDQESPVTPTTPAQVRFTANLPGVFDVELHKSDLKLCELRVQ